MWSILHVPSCTPSPQTRAIIYNAHCLAAGEPKKNNKSTKTKKKQSLPFLTFERRNKQYVFDWCGPLRIISGCDKIWWIIRVKKKLGMYGLQMEDCFREFFSLVLFEQVLIIFYLLPSTLHRYNDINLAPVCEWMIVNKGSCHIKTIDRALFYTSMVEGIP